MKGIVGRDSVLLNYTYYFKSLLSKCYNLFKFSNFPEELNLNFFLTELFLKGKVAFGQFNSKLYCLRGNTGGEPNEYYEPTSYIVANPILGSKTFTINSGDKDTAAIVYLTKADKEFQDLNLTCGIYPLIHQTAVLLADNIVSINCAQINSRVQAIVTADSPQLRISTQAALKKLYEGEPYQVMEQDLLDKINVNPLSTTVSTNSLQQLIETQQYLIAQFYQQLGIKANAINKKERLITDEINVQEDFINVSYNTMYESIKEGLELVNRMFGTNIVIEKSEALKEVNTEEKIQDSESNSAEDSEKETEFNSDTNTKEKEGEDK